MLSIELTLRKDYRPDGKKKAYVRLTADHDALDVANKVINGIVSSQAVLGTDGLLQIGFI